MRGKIPDYVDIVAKKAEVYAFRLDRVDFSECPALYELAQLVNSRAVFKGMPYHEDALLLYAEGHQLFGCRHIGCERLFNKYMFAMQQRLFCQPVVRAYRSGNHNSINIGTKHIL